MRGSSARRYRSCPDCRTRLRRIGQSSETFGSPPTPECIYYQCPGCGVCREYDAYRNAFLGSPPAHVLAAKPRGE